MRIFIFLMTIFVLTASGCSNDESTVKNYDSETIWQVNTTYKVGDQPIFRLSGQSFIEGKQNKYGWIFYDEMDKFKGKTMKVIGISKETEEELELIKDADMYVVNGDMIESGNMNPDETIVPTGFAIPSAGLWRLNVYVDDEYYGYLVVDVKANDFTSWDEEKLYRFLNDVLAHTKEKSQKTFKTKEEIVTFYNRYFSSELSKKIVNTLFIETDQGWTVKEGDVYIFVVPEEDDNSHIVIDFEKDFIRIKAIYEEGMYSSREYVIENPENPIITKWVIE